MIPGNRSSVWLAAQMPVSRRGFVVVVVAWSMHPVRRIVYSDWNRHTGLTATQVKDLGECAALVRVSAFPACLPG